MACVTAKRWVRRVVAALVALTVSACGAYERPSGGDRVGRLVVQKSLAGGPIFIEGSITHLRIVRQDGEVIIDDLRPVDTLDTPICDSSMPPGSYDLSAVERPCEGNCGMLDPPVRATRCNLEVLIKPDETTRVQV